MTSQPDESKRSHPMRTDPVRIGIVGCGDVMARAYMETIEQLRCKGLVAVVAACDVREERRTLAQERFGIPRVTDEYQELVNAEDVDLVLVLTSMATHGPITRAALEAGKHVLVEKPMAVALEEAIGLVDLARRSPGCLLVAPHVVLSPTYRTVAQRLARGDIGKVLLARARYGWSGPYWGPWYYTSSGGPLFDLAVYNVTSLTGWLGPVRRVTAMTGTAQPQRLVDGQPVIAAVEDNAHLLLDFGEAVFAAITTGFTIQKYRSPAIELYGTSGTLQLLGDDWGPAGYELWQNEVGAWQVFTETEPNWSWTAGLPHLVECIRTGTPPVITPEHAFHVLEVLLAARRAGLTGQVQGVESTFAPLAFDPIGMQKAPHLVHDTVHRT